MKRTPLLFTVLLLFTATACQKSGTSTTAADSTAADTASVQPDATVTSSIDRQLQDVDNDLSDLRTRVESASADVKKDMQDDLEDFQKRSHDVDSLNTSLAGITDPEQKAEKQDDVWEKVRDLDMDISEARFKVAETPAAFKEIGNDEMQDLDHEISDLEADSSSVAPAQRDERHDKLEQLRDDRASLQKTWDKAGQSDDSNWKQAREEVVSAWKKVKESLYDIRLPGKNGNS